MAGISIHRREISMSSNTTTRWRRTFATAAIALAATAVMPVAASAAPEGSAVICRIGFVCLQTTAGPVVTVKQGDTGDFRPSGLKVSAVANGTKLNYCVRSSPNYALGPGQQVVRNHIVLAVAPGDFCPLG
jgi:hypothetical protein